LQRHTLSFLSSKSGVLICVVGVFLLLALVLELLSNLIEWQSSGALLCTRLLALTNLVLMHICFC
jgi:hypothetical protein